MPLTTTGVTQQSQPRARFITSNPDTTSAAATHQDSKSAGTWLAASSSRPWSRRAGAKGGGADTGQVVISRVTGVLPIAPFAQPPMIDEKSPAPPPQ